MCIRDRRESGQGRFSHWNNNLYFSASDNSHPGNNGRVYSFTVAEQNQSSNPSTSQPAGSSSNNNTAEPNLPPAPSPTNTNQAAVEGVAYSGVTPTMWSEIRTQAGNFGDNNSCEQKVNSIPSSGHTIGPCAGNCINQALANHDVVVLRPGIYSISEEIRFSGKTLIGLHPTEVIVDASQVSTAMNIGSCLLYTSDAADE